MSFWLGMAAALERAQDKAHEEKMLRLKMGHEQDMQAKRLAASNATRSYRRGGNYSGDGDNTPGGAKAAFLISNGLPPDMVALLIERGQLTAAYYQAQKSGENAGIVTQGIKEAMLDDITITPEATGGSESAPPPPPIEERLQETSEVDTSTPEGAAEAYLRLTSERRPVDNSEVFMPASSVNIDTGDVRNYGQEVNMPRWFDLSTATDFGRVDVNAVRGYGEELLADMFDMKKDESGNFILDKNKEGELEEAGLTPLEEKLRFREAVNIYSLRYMENLRNGAKWEEAPSLTDQDFTNAWKQWRDSGGDKEDLLDTFRTLDPRIRPSQPSGGTIGFDPNASPETLLDSVPEIPSPVQATGGTEPFNPNEEVLIEDIPEVPEPIRTPDLPPEQFNPNNLDIGVVTAPYASASRAGGTRVDMPVNDVYSGINDLTGLMNSTAMPPPSSVDVSPIKMVNPSDARTWANLPVGAVVRDQNNTMYRMTETGLEKIF